MSERNPCCILGCRRTFKREAGDPVDIEFMCVDHYRLADARLRRIRTSLKRRGNRHGWSFRMERLDLKLWAKAKRQATERSMGL